MNSLRKSAMAVTMIIGITVFAVTIAAAACPQQRVTKKAPDDLFNKKNPKSSAADIEAGKKLYQATAKPMPCKMCHGATGKGDGPAGKGFKAPKATRDFTCKDTMKDITEGQIFFVTKNGSPPMMPYGSKLSDDQIWQISAYVKHELGK